MTLEKQIKKRVRERERERERERLNIVDEGTCGLVGFFSRKVSV